MPTWTADQVADLAAFLTPSGTTVAEWVAKARQESSYRTDAINGDAIGLWQVRTIHWNNEAGKAVSASSESDFRQKLLDPQNNWHATRAVYAAQGWGAWRASGGKPTPNANEEKAAAGAESGGRFPSLGSVVDSVNPLDDVADILGQFVDPVVSAAKWLGDPNNWLRILQVTGGIALGVVAVGIFIRPQLPGVLK